MAVPNGNSNSSEWTQSYDQTNFSSVTQIETPQTNIIVTSSRNNNNNNIPADQAGRVSKPLRRRSRASRRAPTTLLNTDAANFRAMVQHFTGGPSMSRDFNFQHGVNAAVGPVASRFHLQYDSNQALMQQQQQQGQMFVIDNMHGGQGGGVSSRAPPGSNENRNFDHYMF